MFVNCCIMARIHCIVVGNDESKLAVLIILQLGGPLDAQGRIFRGFETVILLPAVLLSPLQRPQEGLDLSVKYKQCIIIVERRFTADRSPKAADGNFVERDAKRRASLLPSWAAPCSNLLALPLLPCTCSLCLP